MHHLSKFWCFVFFLFFDDETWLGWNAPSLQANEPWIWLSLSFSLQVNLERVHNQTYLSCSQRIVRKYVNSQGKGTRHTASKPCCHWNLGTVHLLVRKDKDEPFISRLDKGFAWYIYIYPETSCQHDGQSSPLPYVTSSLPYVSSPWKPQ